ncbi:MAG: 50S ribosomal protein L1 [bacterium]
MGKKKIQTIGETIEDVQKPQKPDKRNFKIDKEKADSNIQAEKTKNSDVKINTKQEKQATTDSKSKDLRSQLKRGKNKIRSKNYQKVKKLVDSDKLYDLVEAIILIKKVAYSKFKSNIEVHIRLNINLSKSDEQVRTIVKFPKCLGKKPKILAITRDKDSALKAGATYAGNEEVIEKISKGWIDFNMVIAEPEYMSNLGKVAKTLGTKGLMPNPKTGTISEDVKSKIAEILAGSTEIKNDTSGIIHQVIGAVDDSDKDLINNFQILYNAISKNRFNKKDLIKTIHLSPSMGPSIKIDVSTINTDKVQK